MAKQELVREQALEFLKGNPVATVATASKAGEPQVAAMNYMVEDDFTFYFLTTSQSKKVANLRENDNVAITVWHEDDPVTVQGGGKAELIEKDVQEYIVKFSTKLDTKKPYHWPILLLPHMDYVVIKVKPTWLVWLSLNMEHPETYQSDYFKILP